MEDQAPALSKSLECNRVRVEPLLRKFFCGRPTSKLVHDQILRTVKSGMVRLRCQWFTIGRWATLSLSAPLTTREPNVNIESPPHDRVVGGLLRTGNRTWFREAIDLGQ